MLTWKTRNSGKNHSSPQTANCTMRKEYNVEETQRQRPLVLFLCHMRRLQRGGNYLSLSLSHALYNYLYTTTTFITISRKVCALSHIYTYMTSQHIYICVLLNRSDRSEPVLVSADSLYLPSGGTCFPTGRRCVESVVEYDQRQSIVSKCDTQTLELL